MNCIFSPALDFVYTCDTHRIWNVGLPTSWGRDPAASPFISPRSYPRTGIRIAVAPYYRTYEYMYVYFLLYDAAFDAIVSSNACLLLRVWSNTSTTFGYLTRFVSISRPYFTTRYRLDLVLRSHSSRLPYAECGRRAVPSDRYFSRASSTYARDYSPSSVRKIRP